MTCLRKPWHIVTLGISCVMHPVADGVAGLGAALDTDGRREQALLCRAVVAVAEELLEIGVGRFTCQLPQRAQSSFREDVFAVGRLAAAGDDSCTTEVDPLELQPLV